MPELDMMKVRAAVERIEAKCKCAKPDTPKPDITKVMKAVGLIPNKPKVCRHCNLDIAPVDAAIRGTIPRMILGKRYRKPDFNHRDFLHGT